MSGADQRRQAADLVRLREIRMRSAAAALTEAREATTRAAAALAGADAALVEAEGRRAGAHADLAADPGEAERRLALLDAERFRQTLAQGELQAAEAAERACADEEAARRKAMIVAQLRHDTLSGRLDAMHAHAGRRRDERDMIDAEDNRRFR